MRSESKPLGSAVCTCCGGGLGYRTETARRLPSALALGTTGVCSSSSSCSFLPPGRGGSGGSCVLMLSAGGAGGGMGSWLRSVEGGVWCEETDVSRECEGAGAPCCMPERMLLLSDEGSDRGTGSGRDTRTAAPTPGEVASPAFDRTPDTPALGEGEREPDA